jgi:hypothetical protein
VVADVLGWLSLYTYQFLGKATDFFLKEIRNHSFGDTFIVLPVQTTTENKMYAIAHLAKRVPMFIEGVYRWENAHREVYNALIADTGRVSLPEYAAAHSSMPPLPFQRYGILGSAVAEMTKPRTIWYCHLWGINFESMSSNNIERRVILKLPVD